MITIEKGRYQALLERVLGIQHSEFGMTRGQVLGHIVRQCATALESDIPSEMSVAMENLSFVKDYYDITEETLQENELYSDYQPKKVGKIDLRKNKEEDCY